MPEIVARKLCVIRLDIDTKILFEAIGAQESSNGLYIIIVLVLHRFHGFWLDIEHSLKAIAASIIPRHRQESGKVIFFALEVGIEKGHVAFSATPEYIALTTQLNCSVYRCLDLVGSISHNL